jgi:cell fate regulator YaaT (PSP1 superfamily)
MRLISCEYTLDKAKVLFSYIADDRVDFRELLKVLASRLHTRIELRQIGARDKAKAIGGLGVCGLPLCCSTFLNEFDGISITRAKNQMLAINIPKLSGQCGKLVCCLKFEDDAYTDLRKEFPAHAERKKGNR